jgi:hypothetical protein
MQSVKRSWLESWSNIFIGFGINFTANMVILPLFGFKDLTVEKNLVLGILYTIISLLRSFCIRRWFNRNDDGRQEKEGLEDEEATQKINE